MENNERRLPVGAEVVSGGVLFRVWAPASGQVAIDCDGQRHPLMAEGDGYFSGLVPHLTAGALYKLALDSGTFPDPVSRWQPEGPHGLSQVVDPSRFPWSDDAWPGCGIDGQVLYEMH